MPAAVLIDACRIGKAIVDGDGNKVFKTVVIVAGEWGGAYGGAAYCAAVGSIFPGFGTAIGGVIGAIGGALLGGAFCEKAAEVLD